MTYGAVGDFWCCWALLVLVGAVSVGEMGVGVSEGETEGVNLMSPELLRMVFAKITIRIECQTEQKHKYWTRVRAKTLTLFADQCEKDVSLTHEYFSTSLYSLYPSRAHIGDTSPVAVIVAHAPMTLRPRLLALLIAHCQRLARASKVSQVRACMCMTDWDQIKREHS